MILEKICFYNIVFSMGIESKKSIEFVFEKDVIYINIEIFIKECFEIGLKILNKDTLTKEEKDFLNLLDRFEEWTFKEIKK